MRQNLLFLLSFFVLISARAQQNLVPNPSFEQYSSCPDYGGQIDKATGWTSYCLSPDLFVGGGCNLNAAYFVPGNVFGSQSAYGGGAEKSYAGLMNAKNYMFEYMRATIPSLEIGSRYEVTIYVSPGDNCQFGTDGLGVFFFDKGDTTVTAPLTQPLAITPQIDYSSYGPIVNRLSWTKLTSTFVADSTYDNLVIGGFKPNADIIEAPLVPTASGNYKTFYYIDSVSVVKITPTLIVSSVNSSYCLGDSITVGYTTNIPFQAGNTFTLQLSDATGNFTSPTNIASVAAISSGVLKGVIANSTAIGSGYRVRVLASDPGVTSGVNASDIKVSKAPVIEASSNSPVCSGRTLKLSVTSSDSTATYYWGGPSNISTLKDPEITDAKTYHTGTHYVTATVNGCLSTDSVAVVVKETPLVTALFTDTLVCAGGTLHLSAKSNLSDAEFYWMGPKEFTSSNAENALPQVSNKNNGGYRVVAIAPNGCASDTAELWTNIIDLQAEILSSDIIIYGDTLKLKTPENINGAKYSWTGPAGFYSEAPEPYIIDITSKNEGAYNVTVTYRGCEASRSKWQGVSRRTIFSVLPNPNNGNFTIKGNVLKDQVVSIMIVNQTGQVLYSDKVQTVRKRFAKQISLASDPVSGICFVRIGTEDGAETLRVFISK